MTTLKQTTRGLLQTGAAKLLPTCLACSLTAVMAFTAPAILSEYGYFANSGSLQAAEEEEEGRRAPPSTRQSGVLTRRVFTRIEDVMAFQEQEDYASALEVMAEIKELYDADRLNDREKYTMWMFYASLAQGQEDYRGAIGYYQELLNLGDVVPPDQQETAINYTGQLYYVLEDYAESIEWMQRWLDFSGEEDADIYLRMGTAHYQLENFAEAVPFVIKSMEIDRVNGEEIKQNTYALLRALYLILERWDEAKQVLREMAVLYNEADDWNYLASVHGQLEESDKQYYTYELSYQLGHLEDEGTHMLNLAYQLYQHDDPYRAGKVISMGMESGIIDEDEGNLSFLAQCWQVAHEKERAIAPLSKAAELSEDGELFAKLGNTLLDIRQHEEALDAFEKAIDKGGIDRLGQLYIAQAAAYLDMNRFDDAISSLREARKDDRTRSLADNWIKVTQSQKEVYETKQRQRELYKGFFR